MADIEKHNFVVCSSHTVSRTALNCEWYITFIKDITLWLVHLFLLVWIYLPQLTLPYKLVHFPKRHCAYHIIYVPYIWSNRSLDVKLSHFWRNLSQNLRIYFHICFASKQISCIWLSYIYGSFLNLSIFGHSWIKNDSFTGVFQSLLMVFHITMKDILIFTTSNVNTNSMENDSFDVALRFLRCLDIDAMGKRIETFSFVALVSVGLRNEWIALMYRWYRMQAKADCSCTSFTAKWSKLQHCIISNKCSIYPLRSSSSQWTYKKKKCS